MNAQHQSKPAGGLPQIADEALQYPEEKIGVSRIEVKQASMQLTAILGGFVEVDRLLLAWGAKTDEPIVCEFEVTFLDGYKLEGVYEYCCKTAKRLSLSNFIRSCLLKPQLETAADRKQKFKRVVDRAGEIAGVSVLDQYEIERTG